MTASMTPMGRCFAPTTKRAAVKTTSSMERATPYCLATICRTRTSGFPGLTPTTPTAHARSRQTSLSFPRPIGRTHPVGVALLASFAIHIVRRVGAAHRGAARGKGAEETERGVASLHTNPLRKQGQSLRSLLALRVSVGAGRVQYIFRSLVKRRAAPTLRLIAPPLALYLPVACWGLASFVAYQAYAFGEPLAVVKAQSQWSIRPALDALKLLPPHRASVPHAAKLSSGKGTVLPVFS